MNLDLYKKMIELLCQKHRVKSLYAFGSVLTDKFNEKSDIDLIVDIDSNDPLDYAEKYFEIKFELEKVFNRKIDLLENKSVRNKYLQENIDKTKFLIYAR